jgi:hypothetical protein
MVEGETMSEESKELAIAKAEHLLLVLKLMRDDPQGHHTSIPSTDPEKILFGRWQAVVGDLQELVDYLNEELKLRGVKFIFDTEDLSDMEVEGMIQ